MVRGTDLVIEAPWLARAAQWWKLGDPPLLVTPGPGGAALARTLEAWDAAAPEFRSVQMSSETKEGLKALGYEQ